MVSLGFSPGANGNEHYADAKLAAYVQRGMGKRPIRKTQFPYENKHEVLQAIKD